VNPHQNSNTQKEFSALVIDEDFEEREHISSLLSKVNISVFQTSKGKEAVEILSKQPVDFVITDILLPDTEGVNILRFVKKNQENADVIILTEGTSREAIERILRQGADDYIEKPLKDRDFIHKINSLKQNRVLKEKCGIIGKSEGIRQILETIRLIAPTNVSVLITGESGTGKELVAKAIHENSLRQNQTFIAVNCGALPEGVLESELFGHEKGAFTSADRQRAGRFEIADKGTLFLDEIGEMPLSAQVKLLRVLETKEFMRVGGSQILNSNARIIAATNKNLEEGISDGKFRRDLYYRLKIVTIEIPPLRTRKIDIPLLIHQFAPEIYREHNLPEHPVPDNVVDTLQKHNWPGNVRELRNVLESMIILSPKRALNMNNIPAQVRHGESVERNLPVPVEKSRDAVEREIIYKTLLGMRADIAELKDLMLRKNMGDTEISVEPIEGWVETVADSDERVNETSKETSRVHGETGSLSDMERKLIINTLNSFNGNRKKTAQALGIGERTLYRKLKEYHIS
jgi:DNA-binding NtrC family response regulator